MTVTNTNTEELYMTAVAVLWPLPIQKNFMIHKQNALLKICLLGHSNRRFSEIQGTALGKCLLLLYRSMPAGAAQSRHDFVGVQ